MKKELRKRLRNSVLGMTLIEIMIVILLIGLIMGGGTVFLVGQLNQGRLDTARSQAYEIAKSATLYKMRFGNYPTTAEGLQALVTPTRGEPIMERMPLDPWKREYVYSNPGVHNPSSVDVRSLGPDGVESEDDVGNWPEDK